MVKFTNTDRSTPLHLKRMISDFVVTQQLCFSTKYCRLCLFQEMSVGDTMFKVYIARKWTLLKIPIFFNMEVHGA